MLIDLRQMPPGTLPGGSVFTVQLATKSATRSSCLVAMQVEYTVEGHKSVSPTSDPGPLPPLRVAAINVKAVPDAKDKAQEIVGVSVLHMTMPMDRPLDMNAWQNAHNIRRFSVVCPASGASFPPGLQNLVKVLCGHPSSPC